MILSMKSSKNKLQLNLIFYVEVIYVFHFISMTVIGLYPKQKIVNIFKYLLTNCLISNYEYLYILIAKLIVFAFIVFGSSRGENFTSWNFLLLRSNSAGKNISHE